MFALRTLHVLQEREQQPYRGVQSWITDYVKKIFRVTGGASS